ncbi:MULTISPECIES: glycosyltransferase family 2 protein [unclassified Granulicatella]|uniref:glycosyltransferase n=1 Tax=unclassified Granulicatella TaxID=2630493 RepID=UPI0010731F16|nr:MULTISPECIES: glycosyltransferase family 2 protein [unclassified Granulicatella]MBF0780246.1 glycosyltransferase [Granulicatella sp. 19428wC4_WM01]TFU95627.1 glycosyltransferase family 2 protein [Granulicatella sp. WM01]
MKKEPLVSIICTVFNKEAWLCQTINSFLAQETTFPIEILVIDDASTDNSRHIIERYVKQYPNMIRAIYNEENQGIAKTWVKVCQYAQGKYIARCDGDDFWIDPLKLEKQVTLLQNTPHSKWCNTDFDMYNEHGQLISRAGFSSGTISLADTYEKMLATRGFTMASTWLVERDLMLHVNSMLDLETSDDTFNLQLDLFQYTDLTYLSEATVGYVINQGSDSRPKDFSKVEQRFNRLLDTQKEYLDKYPNGNKRVMLDILLERNNRYELELTKREYGLAKIGIEKVTIYFSNDTGEFSQENTVQYPLAKRDDITIKLPKGCTKIRVDLSEQASFYAYVRLVSCLSGTTILPSFINGVVIGEAYMFPQADPQLIYDIPKEFGDELILHYMAYSVDNIQSDDYVAKVLSQEIFELKMKLKELERLRIQVQQQKDIIEHYRKQKIVKRLYHGVGKLLKKMINVFRRKK